MESFRRSSEAAFVAFEAHSNCCMLTSRTTVEYFDKLRWYSHVPVYVSDALAEAARYYHIQAQLRLYHNNFEIAAEAAVMEFGEDEQRAAAGPDIDQDTDMTTVGFGLETNPNGHLVTVGEYRPRVFQAERNELCYLRACFNMHQSRLEQQPVDSLRYPAEKNFDRSLDKSFLNFVGKMMEEYTDATAGPKPGLSMQISNTVLAIQAYCSRILQRCDQIRAARRGIKAASRPLEDLIAEETDPATTEERVAEIEEEKLEVSIARDESAAPFQKNLRQAIMLTVQVNPYRAAPMLESDAPPTISLG